MEFSRISILTVKQADSQTNAHSSIILMQVPSPKLHLNVDFFDCLPVEVLICEFRKLKSMFRKAGCCQGLSHGKHC